MKKVKRFFKLRALCAFAAVLLCALALASQAFGAADSDADSDEEGGTYGYALPPSGPLVRGAAYDKKFFDLCRTGSAAEVKAAIDAGADLKEIDENGDTPLSASRANPDREVHKLIFEAKFGKFGVKYPAR